MVDRRFDYCKFYFIFAALWAFCAIACISSTKGRQKKPPAKELTRVSQAANGAIHAYRDGLREAAREMRSRTYSDWPSAFKAWGDAAAQVRSKATQEFDSAVNERIDRAEYSDELFHTLLKEIEEGL